MPRRADAAFHHNMYLLANLRGYNVVQHYFVSVGSRQLKPWGIGGHLL